MKKIIISLICLLFALSANAKDHEGIVTENLGVGAFTLISQSQPVSLIVADSDKKGVLVAARNLQKDFERVCGKQAMLLNAPSANTTRYVIAGSLESPYVKQMVKAKKINEKELKGKVEKYIMTVVNNPIPGVDEALVIAGSDMRGTIYGIYELSEQIGVSPWYLLCTMRILPYKKEHIPRANLPFAIVAFLLTTSGPRLAHGATTSLVVSTPKPTPNCSNCYCA